ncbi:LysR family transcriptional regulator [Janthinobacterium fluminis]|uniref:LysR family transcriptional regulator n=1 Tax=Janthinobacterium fluminis TaxID=2987524 RepID=A0ABT5JZC9_9BURK|nr:LysR family transcriptional regulator [Janthinobacterium fluminis]MDC8757949.1 LysR family transcriptional regulator [Janthinobacterium fluminis]
MAESINESRIAYLYEAVRCGTVRGAADWLDVAPSAVSRQITLLEQELAVNLMERNKRGVSPTEAGKLLVEYFREQRSHQADLLSKLQEIRGLRRGAISVIMGEGFIADVVGGPINQFCTRHPDISVVLNIAGTNEVIRAVAMDEAEIGLVFTPPADPKIVSRASMVQAVHAIVGPDFPLLGKVDSLTLADLQPYPLALTHMTYGMRQVVEAAMMLDKVRLTPTVTTNSITVLRHFVRSGLGVTLLPTFAIRGELERGELFAIPVANAALAGAETHLITRVGRKLSVAANRLMQQINSQM